MLTIQQRLGFEAGLRASATFPSASNLLVTEAEQPWEDVANITQIKSGFGNSGVKVGSVESTLSATATRYNTLLMHMESAGLTEESGKVVSVVGTVEYSNVQSVFGGGSALFTAGALSIPNSDDWVFGTGDFTIHARVRFSETGSKTICAYRVDSNNNWQLYTQSNTLLFNCKFGGATIIQCIASWTPSIDTWYHVAVTRASGVIKLYVDGTALTLTTNTTPSGNIQALSTPLYIGRLMGASSFDMTGYIDEVAIIKGIARWTGASFVVPVVPETNSYYSSNLITSGTKSLSPATLKVTIDGVEKNLSVPADLAFLDGAITIDYSFSSSGADAVSGFSETPITPSAFISLDPSTFASKTNFYFRIYPLASQVISAAEIDIQATFLMQTKEDGISISNNGITVLEFQNDGDAIAADITADDVYAGGNLTVDNAQFVGVTPIETAAGTTVGAAADYFVVFTGSTTHTYTLPDCSTGRKLILKNRSTGTVTINRSGSDTIDGGTTIDILADDGIMLIGNSTDWTIN